MARTGRVQKGSRGRSYDQGVVTAPKPRELDLARIRRWVEARVPSEHRDQVRLEVGVHGANVTIFELRPPWNQEVPPELSRRPVAQLRHTGSGFWLLLWQHRGIRWERYPLQPTATRDLDSLLAELDEDGMCLFWGRLLRQLPPSRSGAVPPIGVTPGADDATFGDNDLSAFMVDGVDSPRDCR